MRYITIDQELFISNREKIFSKLPKNSLAIFNSNDIMPTNADGTFPFKQNSDLYYLSGVDQEETILILKKDINGKSSTYLFLRETNDLIAVWEGEKLSKKQATIVSGIEATYWNQEFHIILDQLIKQNPAYIYLNSNEHGRASSLVQTADQRFTNWITTNYPGKNYRKISPLLYPLRMVKSELEIAQIQTACDITEKAFRRILTSIKPGCWEFEIEADITHEFLINRSSGHAYSPIIASGKNACVLHYVSNNYQCKEGELILMDFGASYANYNADLTRCVPVSGRFSKRQKEVYNAVLNVLKQATELLVTGNNFEAYNKQVGEIMTNALIEIGVLDRHDVAKQDPKNPLFRKYFMHGTSHSLGLDVHDVDDRSLPFAPGMIFTCEPGIYLPKEGLGIRIENDILITKKSNQNLMKNIPIEIQEIEELMNT